MASPSCVILSDDESAESDPSSHEYEPPKKRMKFDGIWNLVHSSLRTMQCGPGMKELCQCMQDKRFRLDFANSINAGDILDHASGVILHHLGHQVQRYKIGYTHLPHSRFYNVFQDLGLFLHRPFNSYTGRPSNKKFKHVWGGL